MAGNKKFGNVNMQSSGFILNYFFENNKYSNKKAPEIK